jgi:hypothetical protein
MLGTILWNELRFKFDLLCFQRNAANAHTTQISMQVLRTMFPSRPTSRFGDITQPAASWSCRMLLLPLELHPKQNTWNTFCQYWWSKTANYGVNSKDPYRNSKTCYTILSITTAGVYWTTWWSSTQSTWRLLQTAMINMNAYTFTNVNFFHLALKCHCIQKPSGVTGAPRKTNKHFQTI